MKKIRILFVVTFISNCINAQVYDSIYKVDNLLAHLLEDETSVDSRMFFTRESQFVIIDFSVSNKLALKQDSWF